MVALDTYEVVKELRAAGFDEAQAEALTNAVKRAQQIDLSVLATKTDFEGLATKLDGYTTRLDGFATKSDLETLNMRLDGFATKLELAELKADLKSELATIRSDLLKTILTVAGAQFVAIIGLAVAMLRFAQTGALPTP